MWKTGTRITRLRTKELPKQGAKWRGTSEEFYEFLVQSINQMPPLVKDAMTRHYISGDTQTLKENGRPAQTDSRYYLLLTQGRSILATMINLAQNDKRPLKTLEIIYGK